MGWHQKIADPNGITLPWISERMLNEETANLASADYKRCASWLADQGLYYDLLD